MFSYCLFLAVSLLSILPDALVSSCITNCTDPPVFSPSRLVVKHGDPTSATCSVCQSACINYTFGLERSVGNVTTNKTVISWSIDSLTEWRISLMCFYNDEDSGDQCCSDLPVTVYKPPDSVSISVSNHSGPVLEGRQYTLLCTVQDVAPVESLTVTFYRGSTPLAQSQSNSNTHKPVTETFTHNITMRREDDGAQYWCRAELELGPEGPQRPPVVESQAITTTVHYKPRLESSLSNKLSLTAGDSLLLNCSAVGNPSPLYAWTLPAAQRPPPASSILTVQSVSSEDGGTYNCSARNMLGDVHVTFEVEVRPNNLPYILVAVSIAAVLLIICVAVIYVNYYKHNRMGQYSLKNVFRKQLIPLTTT